MSIVIQRMRNNAAPGSTSMSSAFAVLLSQRIVWLLRSELNAAAQKHQQPVAGTHARCRQALGRRLK
jgi:hypothetical protein